MIVYIDSEFKCHITNADCAFREIETDFFNGKCTEFIEGCRYIPSGETRTREDGTVFQGRMITMWKPYSELDQVQREYEQELAEAARILLGEVSV